MAVMEFGKWYADCDINQLDNVDEFTLPQQPQANRYHLYMSYACPFAHRPYLVINYLGLHGAISVSSVAAKRYDNGWLFDDANPDPINQLDGLVSLYQKAKPDYSGSVTVPVLWDKETSKIVGNGSAEMAMELATNWLPLAKHKIELAPERLRSDISALNEWLHDNINRKVYHMGFAKDQLAYDNASELFFAAMETLDERLGQSRYLFGDEILLSDLFLLPTLVRFEAVYEVHFKANKKPLKAFEHLYRYMLDMVSTPRIRETIDINYMKEHYYFSHRHINPTGIIPAGPSIEW